MSHSALFQRGFGEIADKGAALQASGDFRSSDGSTKLKSAGLETKSEGRASTMLTRTNKDDEKLSVARKMLLGS
jgi:hypothetical protein